MNEQDFKCAENIIAELVKHFNKNIMKNIDIILKRCYSVLVTKQKYPLSPYHTDVHKVYTRKNSASSLFRFMGMFNVDSPSSAFLKKRQ